MLNQELLLELLMGAWLLVRLWNAKRLGIPGCSAMRLRIASRSIAHHVLSSGACSSSGEPRSLGRLPNAMLHGSEIGRNDIRIDGWTGRSCCRMDGLLVMMRVCIHGKAGIGVTIGAHNGLAVVVERHDCNEAVSACTSDLRPKCTLLGCKTEEAVVASVLRDMLSEGQS